MRLSAGAVPGPGVFEGEREERERDSKEADGTGAPGTDPMGEGCTDEANDGDEF